MMFEALVVVCVSMAQQECAIVEDTRGHTSQESVQTGWLRCLLIFSRLTTDMSSQLADVSLLMTQNVNSQRPEGIMVRPLFTRSTRIDVFI